MTFQQAFIIAKLNKIKQYKNELEELLKFSDKEILQDSYKYHTAERLLQLIVDTMIDVNQHFIQGKKLKPSEDFQSTFYILGENRYLPMSFAIKIAPIVGLRNRIIHRYEKLNKKMFIENLRKNISDFEKYINIILKKNP